jgi:hypothetical protein
MMRDTGVQSPWQENSTHTTAAGPQLLQVPARDGLQGQRAEQLL